MRYELYSSVAVLFGVALFYCTAEAAMARGIQSIAADQAGSTRMTIRYEQGVMDAQINQAPLGEVLHELGQRTGVRCHPLDSVTAHQPVTATVHEVSLDEGIKRILRGFSYVMYYSVGGVDTPPVSKLFVLFSPAKPSQVSASASPIDIASAKNSKSSGQNSDAAQITELPNEGVLRSEDDSDLMMSEGDVDPQAVLAEQKEQQETLLLQALDTLQSNQKQLRKQAIDQLVGMDDPRATQALAQQAMDTSGSNGHSRIEAVRSLWLHAADLGFANEATVSALEQLANDADAEVRKAAGQALEDMKQYREHNPSQ